MDAVEYAMRINAAAQLVEAGVSVAEAAGVLAGRVCHERGRELEVGRVPERGAAWKMKDVGPSEPSCGGRLQTTCVTNAERSSV